MDNAKEFRKFPLKSYLVIQSLIMAIIVLAINIGNPPLLVEKIIGISPIYITISLLTFIFLITFWFWRITDRLEKEEKQAQNLLKINPKSSSVEEKLRLIEKQKEAYVKSHESIFYIFLLLLLILAAYLVFSPFYRF